MALREESGVRVLHPPVPQVIQACHEAGGIAVVAHPGHDTGVVFTFDEENIAALEAEGLNGVEVLHPAHTKAQEDDYVQIADRLGLVKTGGSDTYPARSLKKWSAARIATGMRCSNTWNASPL